MNKLAIFLTVVAVASAQVGPQLNITNAGDIVEHITAEPELDYNAVSHICNIGVWMVHTGQNYEGDLVQIFPEFEKTCRTPFASNVGSIRLAGADGDFGAPSVTVFTTDNMGGVATSIDATGSPQLPQPVHSVVTINSDVQFYEEIGLNGRTVCVLLPVCQDEVCWEFTFSDEDVPDNAWPITASASAKAGCDADVPAVKLRSKNVSTISGL